MKGYAMYSNIQQMREAGFSQRATAKTLGINRENVNRYWSMNPDEYEKSVHGILRIQNLDPHREQIIS